MKHGCPSATPGILDNTVLKALSLLNQHRCLGVSPARIAQKLIKRFRQCYGTCPGFALRDALLTLSAGVAHAAWNTRRFSPQLGKITLWMRGPDIVRREDLDAVTGLPPSTMRQRNNPSPALRETTEVQLNGLAPQVNITFPERSAGQVPAYLVSRTRRQLDKGERILAYADFYLHPV